jgi:hypothetical protein
MKRLFAVVLCLAVSAAIAKDKAAKADIKKLKPTLAAGWEGEFNEALKSWTFEKYTPGPDDTNVPNRFYLDSIDASRPNDVEKYAKKLQTDQNFQDMGYLFTSIAAKEKLAGGWLITGVQKDMSDKEDKGHPAFVLYRDDLGVYCRGGVFVSEALRAEAIEGCKSLKP